VFPDGYLQHAYAHVARSGGVCVADEVQAGFGRTGTHFWGLRDPGCDSRHRHHGEGIGNGAPLAAVVTTRKSPRRSPRVFTSTRSVAIRVLRDRPCGARGDRTRKAPGKQLRIGAHLTAGFEQLAKSIHSSGKFRGLGLMLGVELVKDRTTKTPAKEECAAVFEKCRELGLLIGKGGLWGNTLRIKPR